jgi:hypothetical protein
VQSFSVEKGRPKVCAPFAIFKQLPKENNHLKGENSPNQITLVTTQSAQCRENF